MEHNRNKDLGENIDVFAHAVNTGTFEMFALKNDGTLSNITPGGYVVQSIGPDFTKVNITLPTYDCIVCCVLNTYPVFLRVGEPTIRYMMYTGLTSKTIPYSRYDVLGNVIENGILDEYGNGIYGYIPSDTVYSIIKANNFYHSYAVPYLGNGALGSDGSIELQRGVWQMIAIPVNGNVNDIFIEPLATQEGVPATDLIEVVSCYRGDQDKFLNFVPGVTNVTSEHNFPLVFDDNGSIEIVGMWVKTKNWQHTVDDILFSWNN